MFVKMSELKKLMKEAYKKGCLIIGNVEKKEELVIGGNWWTFGIHYDHAPKELKAAVIEYGGELPYEDFAYRAGEDGNQLLVGITDGTDPQQIFRTAEEEMLITKAVIDFTEPVRLLQNGENGHIVGIKNRALRLLDLKELDYDGGEYEPQGPYRTKEDTICWGNNVCHLVIWPLKLLDEEKENEQKEFFRELEKIYLLS